MARSVRKGARFLVWSPHGSPLRIEYAPALFHAARSQGAAGILLGSRSQHSVRVAAARVDATQRRLNGLEPVGIFSVRVRGEVFLTEDDLERFDKTGAAIALVLAGGSAGFFVRQPDGSIRSIKSHKEIAAPLPPAAGKSQRWSWFPLLALARRKHFLQ
jgi:hypothetical protein